MQYIAVPFSEYAIYCRISVDFCFPPTYASVPCEEEFMEDELLAVIPQECPASTCSKQLATERKAFRDELVAAPQRRKL